MAIGHVTLRVSNMEAAATFYRSLGLRPIVERPGFAILELRGGTHLLLFRAKGKPKAGPIRGFDFMADDVEAARASIERAGIPTTSLPEDRVSGHRSFEVSDPDGHVVTVYSSHTAGRPV